MGFVYLAATAEEVPAILKKAEESGGEIVKPATRTPWGIAGYFKNLDGNLFEVDFEETWNFDPAHRLIVGMCIKTQSLRLSNLDCRQLTNFSANLVAILQGVMSL